MLGVIGGSGLYAMDGLRHTRWERGRGPFGDPSDELLLGELDGEPVAFLPRHGRGHRIPPSQINSRANIHALKQAGVTDLIAVSAVGSLREDLPPGTIVLVDQFVDRTISRPMSFFGPGCVAHVSLADPVCRRLGDALAEAGAGLALPIRRGATAIVIEGPQFSTRAESQLYRQWGCDVVGMTSMPEARLAREAELCYAAVTLVTDWDCWHPEHGTVSVDAVMAVMHANAEHARALIRAVAPRLTDRPVTCPQGCDRALDAAIATPPEAREAGMVQKLQVVAGRALGLTSAG